MNKLYIKYGRMTKFSSVNSLHWGKQQLLLVETNIELTEPFVVSSELVSKIILRKENLGGGYYRIGFVDQFNNIDIFLCGYYESEGNDRWYAQLGHIKHIKFKQRILRRYNIYK